jgi:hypothetical protein
MRVSLQPGRATFPSEKETGLTKQTCSGRSGQSLHESVVCTQVLSVENLNNLNVVHHYEFMRHASTSQDDLHDNFTTGGAVCQGKTAVYRFCSAVFPAYMVHEWFMK